MQYSELKTELLSAMVLKGYTDTSDIPTCYTEGIPSKFISRWLKQFHTVEPITSIPVMPRLMNRFTVGADPEFSFAQITGDVVHAQNYNLQAALAFGMDINGRLVELRPSPSRFVLDIVASILAELRWLSIVKPQTMDVSWIANPFFADDGVGGHVHFARKRRLPELKKDLDSLDCMFGLFTRGGIFDRNGVYNRSQKTKYGRPTDYRPQKHGYEYRSLPTWMDSPWMAYLTLTVAKLVVGDRDFRVFAMGDKAASAILLNLLKFHKGHDDDARICLMAYEKYGWPKPTGKDFKANWGILYMSKETPPQHIPAYIDGSPLERQAIFDYMTKGTPIRPERPQISWSPSKYPDKYKSLFDFTQTYRRVGIGELCVDHVCHESRPVMVSPADTDRRCAIYLPGKYKKLLEPQITKAFYKLFDSNQHSLLFRESQEPLFTIYPSQLVREAKHISTFRRFMRSGFFPLWTAQEVTANSLKEWEDKVGSSSSGQKLKGKELTLGGSK